MSQDDTREAVSALFSSIITPLGCSLQHELQEINLQDDSQAFRIYGKRSVTEKYNCNYGLDEAFKERFLKSALRPVGINPAGDIRMVELSSHPFFMATLFQPQLAFLEGQGHPLINTFLKSAHIHKCKKMGIEAG